MSSADSTFVRDALAAAALSAVDPPRSDEVCRPFVNLAEPPFAFVIYGVLWCLFSVVALGVFGATGAELADLLHDRHAEDTVFLVFA